MCLEDTVRIPLRARDGSVRAYALVDAADAERVNQWRWSLTPQGYARRGISINGIPFIILLHRELLGLPLKSDGRTGDHINRDKLDNRRANLRILSQAENAQNRPSAKGATSQYRGVHWSKHHQKWVATVGLGGKQLRLGTFHDEEVAASVAREARGRLLPHATD